MTREEHLAWCKKRALEYVEQGEIENAWASMVSDMNKHPKTKNHIGIELGSIQLMSGMIKTPDQMRHFIEGFN